MCLSTLSSSLSFIPLTSYLVSLNLISLDSPSQRAPPDLFDVTKYPAPTTSALAFDPAAGEVIWLGVPVGVPPEPEKRLGWLVFLN
ncbi:hypothetical protein N7466_009013 [Penicillium verhagenii]|uniref:uncharacterized protein n=1 Tax=Penicillium verhagenii TaxID=1562060 RepID=UPI0025453457|nr:uncharacterized protein N7466_009013 [Penicillium verhagenii]KAJ5924826.1 hypothetical protein N7466_009013 [Penicillium verhagenii]